MAKIDAVNLNDDLLQDRDQDGVGDLEMGLIKDSRSMANSISTPNAPLLLKTFKPQTL